MRNLVALLVCVSIVGTAPALGVVIKFPSPPASLATRCKQSLAQKMLNAYDADLADKLATNACGAECIRHALTVKSVKNYEPLGQFVARYLQNRHDFLQTVGSADALIHGEIAFLFGPWRTESMAPVILEMYRALPLSLFEIAFNALQLELQDYSELLNLGVLSGDAVLVQRLLSLERREVIEEAIILAVNRGKFELVRALLCDTRIGFFFLWKAYSRALENDEAKAEIIGDVIARRLSAFVLPAAMVTVTMLFWPKK